jgi:cysteinyl-tRNA synthetase
MIRLYDTRTRQVETIEPARRGLLRMYTCGPTVYRQAHVADLRSYLIADLIRRNAEHRHHLGVLTCQNVADVGHLADGAAGEEPGADGRTAQELGRLHEDAFRADCSALNLRPAEHSPRASESIGTIIDMIAALVEAGHAYPAPDGSVYFDAGSFPSYGELSGSHKRFHADWALWRGATADHEMTWPSPWGTGFPGWHIECSALSLYHLGDVIDVHTGGIGLCFPHHEDERAESNSAAGREVARRWVHGERLLFEDTAMARSNHNVVLVADLAGRGLDPLALRLAFLGHHYRQQMNLTWDTLSDADRTLGRWREQVAQWACSPSKPVHGPAAAQIAAAFDDDLDTPAALRALRRLERDQDVAPGAKFETFAHADQLLGLDLARDVGRVPARPQPPERHVQTVSERGNTVGSGG